MLKAEVKFLIGTATLTAGLVFGSLYHSETYKRLRHFQLAAGTTLKSLVRLEPKWPEHLKILAYDDKAAKYTQRPWLSEGEWADIIRLIERQKPKSIIFDKIFAVTDTSNPEGVSSLIKQMELGGNVWAALSLSDQPLPFSQEVTNVIKGNKLVFENVDIEDPLKHRYLYTAKKSIANALKGSGHILYQGAGNVRLVEEVPDQKIAIGHLSLAAADSIKLEGHNLTVNNQLVTFDEAGFVPIYHNFAQIRDHMTTLTGIIQRTPDDASIDYINEGDTVLVLPLTYTGNTDIDTALSGGTPKGLVLASLIRNVLTNDWIYHEPISYLNLIGIFLFGIQFALVCSKKYWLRVTSAISLSMLGVAALQFALSSIDINWIQSLACFLIPNTLVYLRKMRNDLYDNETTVNTLSRAIPPDLRNELLDNPELLNRAPSEKIVTLMFIDIVNFSIFAESNPPKEVFEHLKSLLQEMSKIITDNHGIVDKTLGDGLLAIFGYDFTGRDISYNQSDAAIRSATAIQHLNYRHCIENAKLGRPALPLRIGINTAAVYLGDLDGQARFDFTVIGHGVNLTQRLEAACDPGSVLVSSTSYEVANHFRNMTGRFVRRMIKIKHHSELFEVFNYEPLADLPELRKPYFDAIRAGHCIDRSEKRLSVSENVKVSASLEGFGEVDVLDYSKSGCSIAMKKFLARGIKIRFTFSFAGTNNTIHAYGEVRWGLHVGEERYMHGIKYINLSKSEAEELFQAFNRPVAIGDQVA